jgi:hypothetical protein
MHLKTVGLLFRARLRVDAPDIWFGLRIGLSSHEACLTTSQNVPGINGRLWFHECGADLPGDGKSQARHFLSYSASVKSA